MKLLLLYTFIILVMVSSTFGRRRRSQVCKDRTDATATMVFTGTVERLYRLRAVTYRGVVKVKRVVKGDANFAENTIIVEGFGDPNICNSDVRERDTRIFWVSRLENGHLRLNSSVMRVTVTNLEKVVAAVRGLPPKARKNIPETECEKMYCAYGALCVIDKRTQQAHCRCQETCSDVFAPVCGSDDVTYSSDCQLRMASCTKQKRIFTRHQGPCDLKDPCKDKPCHFGARCQPSLDGRTAECICPEKCATYGDSRSRPVCGTDGKDYPNVCELRRTSCLEMRDIEVRYKGHCDPCETVKCPTYQVCQLDENRNPICRCNDFCNPDFRPVCGSDGRTYTNECTLRVQGCKTHRGIRVIYSGDCSASLNPCDLIECGPGQECDVDPSGSASCQCPPTCESRIHPVCGSNGRTFDNECELKRQSCLLRHEIEIVHQGECGDHGPCHTHHCSYGAACVVKNGIPVCECPTCAEELEPVCGTDGISYTNPCKLKREACQQKTDIIIQHYGLCNICSAQQCNFHAVCESLGQNQSRCVCPEVCIKVDAPVCGTDGVSYPNECELRVEACRKQDYIAIATKGSCDLCEHVHCKYGARCESGRCVCPTNCPHGFEFVCGTDGKTYMNECEMKRVGCQKSRDIAVQFYGTCGEATDHFDEGDTPALKERPIRSCQDKQCRFGGVCDFNNAGAPFCVCTFHCPGMKEPVCGSDGRMYDNECRMREQSCLLQKRIEAAPREACVNHVDIACDGESPVVDPATSKDYFCGIGPGSKLCPAKTVCHVTKYFSKCCNEAPLIKTCEDTTFGCCPDQKHIVLGPNNGGCPSICNCNSLGSYSLTCDPVSKQCPCKPGVGGLRCDRCEPGYWGLHKIATGNSACAHCNCNPYGSIRDDCEQTTGRCVCKHGIQGMKCDRCPPGTVLSPDGCTDESLVNNTAINCDDLLCHHGATCIILDSVPTCSCEFRCNPEDSRDPVCGEDGNTYGSECQMRLFGCRYQRPVTVRYYGVCRKGILSDSEVETTLSSTRLPKRRSYIKRHETVLARAAILNLPQNLFLTTRSPLGYNLSTTTVLSNYSEPAIEVEVPSFSGKSFMELYKLEAYTRLSLEIEFKSFANEGILLYNGQTSSKIGDFVSLSLNDGFIELRYNLGSGPVVLRSQQRITLGKFHRVKAKRHLKDGLLLVEGQEKVSGRSHGTLKSLDLAENLFVGYVPGFNKIVALNTGVNTGLNGCIRRLKIDHRDVNLVYPTSKDILRSYGINECADNLCRELPCKNGGTCISATSKTVQCRCPLEFTGDTCEQSSNPCSSNPCHSSATCIPMPKLEFICQCGLGRTGKTCDKERINLSNILTPDFKNDSYIELPTLPNAKHAHSLEIWFLPRSSDGVILYNGQMLKGSGDFIAINLNRGHVSFLYNLGSGSVNITSLKPLSLNRWHSVKVSRLRRQGTLKVDNETTIIGKSKPPLTELNLVQPLYVGGVPNIKHVHQESGITKGMDGAIQRISMNGKLWDRIMSFALKSSHVDNYVGHPCVPNACLFGGVCSPEFESYSCKCGAKFVGKRCEMRIGKKDLSRPLFFNGTTHLSFPYANTKGLKRRKSNHFHTRLRTTNPSGLLFWTSRTHNKKGHFLAAAIVEGRPVLTYHWGRSQRHTVVVESDYRIDDGRWHSISFHRKKRLAEIRVDKIHVVSNTSHIAIADLMTDGRLWIGGVSDIPEGLLPSDFYSGFEGCMDSIIVDKSPIHQFLAKRNDAQFCRRLNVRRREVKV